MIKEKDLEHSAFSVKNPDGLIFDGDFSYAFDIRTQTLYMHDEVNGELTFMSRITDIQELEEIYHTLLGRSSEEFWQ
jgi:hypothetical protein